MSIKHLTPRAGALKAFLKEREKYEKYVVDAFQRYFSGEDGMNEVVNKLLNKYEIRVHSVQRSAGSNYRVRADIPGGKLDIIVEPKKIEEGIKHLGPKSEDEMRNSLKGLSYAEKLRFAKENNLPWLKKDAEEDLKKNYKDLPLETKFQYAQDYKIDWLKKEAENQFRKETENISPVFLELYEHLKKVIGQDFDYEIDYHLKGLYDLRIIFQANGVYFLVGQSTRQQHKPPPEIKVGKKTAAEFAPLFFTDAVYITNVKQMMAYIKSKIKENERENKK